jgi:hypothetical protein
MQFRAITKKMAKEGKLSPVLMTCQEYGKLAPGECRLASLGSTQSPPPGHVNSLTPMFLRTSEDAARNLSYAALHFSRLAKSLSLLAEQSQEFIKESSKSSMLGSSMRDLVVQANELVTNACIVGDGMTGAMRVPDAITMLMTTRLNPAGSDCGREVAQPLLKELDAILEGGDDVAMFGSALDKYWSKLKESGLLLSLVKEQGKDKGKSNSHLTGVLAAFREQLFMACATAPMQVMRRSSVEQYALPDCLEAIVRMHTLGPQRALEIAGEMGCSCLFPCSLEKSPTELQVRQLTGGGMCSLMTIKTAIKEDATSQSALQAHENIVARRALLLPKEPRKRALKAEEALELAELKAEATERSRKRTKASEQGVIFVRSSLHKRKPKSDLSTSLHMFDSGTLKRLDKDNMATAISSVHAQPILLVPEDSKPRARKQDFWKDQPPLSYLLENLEQDGIPERKRRMSKKMKEASMQMQHQKASEEYQHAEQRAYENPFQDPFQDFMDFSKFGTAQQFAFPTFSPEPCRKLSVSSMGFELSGDLTNGDLSQGDLTNGVLSHGDLSVDPYGELFGIAIE